MTAEIPNVSRETLAGLQTFEALVLKWNSAINLISKSSVSDVWNRHIADSAQLFDLAPVGGHWVDLGSGGGFPGIVVAILSKGRGRHQRFTLIESDQRKSVFLRTAARELDLDIAVLSERIEKVQPLKADIVTARALTDISGLLNFANLHLGEGGICLFPKGENWIEENDTAQSTWSYECEVIKSVTNPKAAILKIKDIARV